MADDQDESSKTEEPTQRRLDQAAEKGDVGRSQEINHWFMFLAIALGLSIFAGGTGRRLAGSFMPFLEAPHAIDIEGRGLQVLFGEVLAAVGLAVLPLFGLVVVFAIAASLVQNKIQISTGKIMPDLSRISPLKGFGRYFSMSNMVEFAKSMLKVSTVGAVAIWLVWPKHGWLPQLVTVDIVGLMPVISRLTMLMLGGVLAVMTLVAGVDLVYQKLSHRKKLRMSRHDIKEEMRQSEGDPVVKGRLKALRMQRSRKRMMAMVPKADVVVVNPTHYAVALKYDNAVMGAPRVVAKGVDVLAARIRALATENEVPIVENPPLARALYTLELDSEVPVEHYRAVAEIIGYVMRLKGKLPGPAVLPRATAN